ncbi:CDK5 regulatory subunit-associated protein 2 isoform X3 [Canis lupus familiaris]|uniref:CDK5 regulatory subunit-associated protein 2 isoform X3 n=1 Tax=Canis lupus familiaris TaxID=9615 RepID=UPI0018F2F405|nr:CDK5 regulatory subunit-associated protein 2 isoform X3 [Canis lupus familiaris]
MDSMLGADATVPGTLGGCSGLARGSPDEVDAIGAGAGLGDAVLPDVSEETVSPTRARNMKDFENQITELKKENFNLKLRIYFLEERMQQEFDGPTEHIYKTNIELKVEVESLKRELQEREQLLIKASKAVESLAERGGSEVQRVKEDAQKKVQQVEDLLTKRIFHLEEDVKAAQAELEKAFAGTETEKALRLSLENKLSEMKKRHEGDVDMAVVLEQKDRLIEDLKLSLKSKEALIQCLKEEKSQLACPGERVSSGELRGLSAAPRGEQERGAEALQEDLREKEREIAAEKKNSLKRDKAIQGLTMALKSKEKEVEDLSREMEELSAALAKVTDAPQEAQTQKLQGSEDYEAALLEKVALLAQLHSENINKSAENHRLRRNIKKVTQELSDLQQERERLEKDLEEAHRDRGRGDHTIHDLRNEVEKLRNEVNEREKAMENRYKSLLSESNKKLHSQEQMIRSLRGSIDPEDLLLQEFSEKDSGAVQPTRPSQSGEELRARSGDSAAKCSLQRSPGSNRIFSEEKQQLDYEELLRVLKKERDIYAHLVKSLQDPDSINSLQAELNSIFALRKQLEQDVLSYRNLQKTLEEQISEIRRREEEPFSFYSDQTSYLSICLEEPNRFQVEHFSQEELKKKVSDLIQLVRELHADNQHLKKTMLDLSCMGAQGGDRLGSAAQSQLLASKEDEDTTRIGADDENNFPSDQHLEQSDKVVEDFSKGGCKNGYSRHTDSSILDYDGAHTPGCPGDQSLEEGELLNLLAPFFNEKATLFLESRPDLLKVLRELLLERMRSLEQGVSAEHLDGKTEKSLTPVAVQLGGELGHLAHVDSSSKSRDDPRSPWTARLLRAGEAATRELKDASVQTVAAEGDTLRFTNQGKRGVWEEEPPDATFHAEGQPQSLCLVPGRPAAALSFPSGADKDAKKSRLPILIKPSRSLGNVYRLPATQEVVAQLQGQILELQGELKEFKICNKQLHQKLILAEAMMEERPAADKTLQEAQPLVGAAYQDGPGEQNGAKAMPCVWRATEGDSDHATHETGQNAGPCVLRSLDAETRPPDGLAVLPTCQRNSEGFPGPAAVAACRSSKSPLSSTVRVFGAHPSENIDTSSDTENLKQKIRDLETELQGYRNFLFQLQKHSQCSEAIITVLCGTEGGQDVLSKPKGSADEEEMTFSSLHRVRYVKHMKILRQLAPEVADGGLLEGLRQQLLQQECELQKEQNLNMELFSEIHNLQNKFRDLSPSRYDSLVQSQARELSLQRQQIKESHGICVIYRQHMNATMKAFERLLRAGGVDHDVAEGFQEQLNQCAGLLEKLEKLFLSGKSVEVDVSPQTEVMERMEEDSSTYRHILPESPEPSASHALSDCEVSEKSSVLSRDQKQDSEPEKASVLANRFSQDLVMEHIQEIRSLRRRLEESIRTNEELRGQLERQGHEPDPGATNAFAYGSELHDSLTSEICFLRKQNQALNTMLAKGSRDKQKENEKLRESLSRKAASLELLQREYACVKGDNERLQSEVRERERHTQQLLREVCSSRSELSRAREEAQLRQQLLSQNEELLQSLRVELKVYERLDEEHHRPREVGAEACGEGCRGQDPSSDLRGLLTEIQALRGQLEKSIETSSALRSRLEEQLALEGKRAQEAALTVALQTLTVPEWPLHPDKHGGDGCPVAIDNSCDLFDSTLAVPPPSASETPPLSENDSDSLSCHSGVSATSTSCTSHPVPGHRLWASKSGCHVLGLTADYEALCQQIGRGQKLFAEMALQIQEAPRAASPELGTKGPHSVPLHTFVTSVGTAKLILEEAARLLTLFWRVSLPTNGQCTLHCGQTGEMKAEITKLHKKLFEQEKKLQNSLKLLQLSKHQEKVIFDQLVITHKVLRKARGNLELRPGGAHPGTSSPSRPGS